MTTPTKARRKKAAPKNQNTAPELPAVKASTPAAAGHGLAEFMLKQAHQVDVDLVRLADLAPCPYQPRRTIDPEELRGLAESLKVHGLLQPVVVREVGPDAGETFTGNKRAKFELVAGERRCRAALLAGWAEIPASLRKLTDREAREVALLENLQRQDLDPIETALAYQQLTTGPEGLTQMDLAGRLGVSQAQIANRIRLLQLPAEWQRRVIAREISPSHARELVPWAELPAVLAEVADSLKFEGVPPLKDWQGVVIDCANHVSRAIDTNEKRWSSKHGYTPIFKPTEAERAKLQILEVDGTPRAFNVKLWEKLQDQHAATWSKEQAKGAKGSKAKGAKAVAKPALTEWEIEAKRKAGAKRFADRLEAFVCDWRRYLIYQALGASHDRHGPKGRAPKKIPGADPFAPSRLLLYLAAGGGSYTASRDEILASSVYRPRKIRKPSGREYRPLQQVEDLDHALLAFLARWVWHDNAPQPHLMPDTVRDFAADLGIDLAAAWQADYCGPLTEQWLRLHRKDQLLELGTDLGAFVEAKHKTDQIVDKILRHLRTVPTAQRQLPKELAKYAK